MKLHFSGRMMMIHVDSAKFYADIFNYTWTTMTSSILRHLNLKSDLKFNIQDLIIYLSNFLL